MPHVTQLVGGGAGALTSGSRVQFCCTFFFFFPFEQPEMHTVVEDKARNLGKCPSMESTCEGPGGRVQLKRQSACSTRKRSRVRSRVPPPGGKQRRNLITSPSENNSVKGPTCQRKDFRWNTKANRQKNKTWELLC